MKALLFMLALLAGAVTFTSALVLGLSGLYRTRGTGFACR